MAAQLCLPSTLPLPYAPLPVSAGLAARTCCKPQSMQLRRSACAHTSWLACTGHDQEMQLHVLLLCFQVLLALFEHPYGSTIPEA